MFEELVNSGIGDLLDFWYKTREMDELFKGVLKLPTFYNFLLPIY